MPSSGLQERECTAWNPAKQGDLEDLQAIHHLYSPGRSMPARIGGLGEKTSHLPVACINILLTPRAAS